jgi:hypothetical protein
MAWLAFLWAIGNCLYVYLALAGARAYRIESAVFILVVALVPLLTFTRPIRPGDGPALTSLQSRLAIALSAGLWLFTLVPFLTLPFLSDDYVFLAAYQRWSDVFGAGHMFRPAFATVFFVVAKLGNGSAVPFHLIAMLLHAASAWLVYVLARRMFRRSEPAVVCFVVFLLNPLQLEPVVWASGLQELLWTFFALASLVVYTGSQQLSARRLTATLVLATCALLSKETATSLVLLMPAADWIFFRMKRGTLVTAAYGAFAVVACAYLWVRFRVQAVDANYFVMPNAYFVKQFVGMPYRFFAQPWNAAAMDITPSASCAASLAIIALLFVAALRGAGLLALAGPAVVLISTLPVYGYFYVGPDLHASRYLYFATFGWSLLLAHLLVTVSRTRRTFGGALVAIILASFLSLRLNAKPWRTADRIVADVETAIRSGTPPDVVAVDWVSRYGPGLEVKRGIPYVYEGVYLFVNGYPEFRDEIQRQRRTR